MTFYFAFTVLPYFILSNVTHVKCFCMSVLGAIWNLSSSSSTAASEKLIGLSKSAPPQTCPSCPPNDPLSYDGDFGSATDFFGETPNMDQSIAPCAALIRGSGQLSMSTFPLH
ncbi:jg16910 [Pararge aegeria aegeria]|uniref:Jg16910 protein n=1 Tax=Pararge aegeria aegeria TaxID=348720 RepID=A0A8S4SH61_9NEOP|nr:jg16910 [Pararge aegeria aegeria]